MEALVWSHATRESSKRRSRETAARAASGAGVYTSDIKKAFEAIKRVDVGGMMVNDTSIFRVDQMPYGGNKMSGIGREGVRFAIEEMTNIRMVCFNLA